MWYCLEEAKLLQVAGLTVAQEDHVLNVRHVTIRRTGQPLK